MIAKRVTELKPGDFSPFTDLERIVDVHRSSSARYSFTESVEVASATVVNLVTESRRTYSVLSTDPRTTVALTEDEVQPWMVTADELNTIRRVAEMLDHMAEALVRFTREMPIRDAAHTLRQLADRVDLTNHTTKENHHAMD